MSAAMARVVALQPVAIIDHLIWVEKGTYSAGGGGAGGGSKRISLPDLRGMIADWGEFKSQPGGSAANTSRALSVGFDVPTSIVGSVSSDEWGAMFLSSVRRCGIGTGGVKHVDAAEGMTGRCCVFVERDDGRRTMRTCMDDCVRLQADDLRLEHFQGAEWVFLSAYALYGPGLLARSVELAAEAGCGVAVDLASFEVVQAFREELLAVLAGGGVRLLFGNEDEAAALFPEAAGDAEESARRMLGLSGSIGRACVTLGPKGCCAAERDGRGGLAVVSVAAAGGVRVVDTTGAGDAFQAGFIYGVLNGHALERCCEIGNLAGGGAVMNLGAELTPDAWQWVHSRLVPHGSAIASEVVRSSAAAVNKELLACYELVHKLGRGCVYYGSARLKADSPLFGEAMELAARVSQLLGCTTWTGGGPGMMQAATLGAQRAKMPVGGIRIQREAGTNVLSSATPIVPVDCSVICKFLSARKVALVDAGVRQRVEDRTAYIYLPGGVGTMDEFFELLTLTQLNKLGSNHPVPLILMNYNDFYRGLLSFLDGCVELGTLGKKEIANMIVCETNEQAIGVLTEFYGL